MRRYALRDDQWDRIKEFLPGQEGQRGGTAKDNRLFVEAVLFRFRAGVPWRDLPERFGRWETVWQRYDRWSQSGVFERIFNVLAADYDNEYMMLDATIVRAHQHSAGAKKSGEDQAIGRSRGGLTTKIHALVDALGNPVAFSLTPGQASDLSQAEPLLENFAPEAFLADKAYDADRLILALQARSIKPVIPPKANRLIQRPCDFALYRERNLVERFFNTLKHFRALATRYDKLARNFLSAVYLVGTLILLK